MKKTSVLALTIAAILIVSAAVVLSHSEWRSTRSQRWDKDNLVTLEGKITDVGRPTATVKVGDEEYILHLGPLWHQEEGEYSFEREQTVKVTGVVDEIYGRLHVYPHTIESEGKSITLVDENGVPHGDGYCHEYGSSHGWNWRDHMRGWRGHGHMM